MFGTASDYHELNAGAHRKPPKILSAPALVWYLAFWTDAAQSDEAEQAVKTKLDTFILLLGASIKDRIDPAVDLSPCISGVHLLFKTTCRKNCFSPEKIDLTRRQGEIFTSISRAVALQFKWQDLDVTIRFEIHAEYISISTFVELDKANDGPPFSSLPELNAVINKIMGYFRNSRWAAKGVSWNVIDRTRKYLEARGDQIPDQESNAINEYFFDRFWKQFEDALQCPSLAEPLADGPFREVFADFRGFIASDRAIEFNDKDEFFHGEDPPRWGKRAKNVFLPLIQHRDLEQRTRYECSTNYLLDGRAMYMSTLGPQLPSVPPQKRIPVEFIVYAHQRFNGTTIVNRWQLGRLVNQLLLVDTLRLCALRHVNHLHAAGQQLAQLEEITQKAREAIAVKSSQENKARQSKSQLGSGAASDAGDGVAIAITNEEMVDRIGAAHEKLNGITGTFLQNSNNSGLLYRIERSRYYVKQFEENVKLLRIRRVEGDQPYDQFIRRRLGAEFDFIDRLGRRYERATGTLLTLDQNYLAITQSRLVGKTYRIDEEAKSIQADIHTIQEWGEFILLAALVPYYVSHILVLIVGEHMFFVPAMALCVWAVFAWIAFYRKLRNARRRKAWQAVVATFALILIVWSATWVRANWPKEGTGVHKDADNPSPTGQESATPVAR